MDSKTRVKKALSHYDTGRVPMDLWAENSIKDDLLAKTGLTSYEALYRYLDIDLRYIQGSVYKGPMLKKEPSGATQDIWGVMRMPVAYDINDMSMGNYEHVTYHPLAEADSIKEIEDYLHWPSPDWYDYDHVATEAGAYPHHAVVCGGDRLNRTAQLKTAMYLRGMQQIMLDIAVDPGIVEAILERLVAFYLEYNRRIFEKSGGLIDIFFMGDDFGMQSSLIMSVNTWRKFFKPGFKRFIELSHSYNIPVMHHTCGAIAPLIPEFIDCGLDILQSLQPNAAGMDFEKMKKEYGTDICFQGGIDIQNTLPFGSITDVINETRNRIDVLGKDGGYILCSSHNIPPKTPVDNILAMYETALLHQTS